MAVKVFCYNNPTSVPRNTPHIAEKIINVRSDIGVLVEEVLERFTIFFYLVKCGSVDASGLTLGCLGFWCGFAHHHASHLVDFGERDIIKLADVFDE